eukprot:180459-Pyramimonas_sp.AAC.2
MIRKPLWLAESGPACGDIGVLPRYLKVDHMSETEFRSPCGSSRPLRRDAARACTNRPLLSRSF